MNLSRYFTLAELTHSKTAQAEGINNQPSAGEVAFLGALCVAVLDPLREAAGQSIQVNSGYRGPALNRRLKGAAKSQHLDGQAADIESPGMTVLNLFKKAIELQLPFDQIIYEVNGASKWVHVSHNPATNRGEILLAQFDAGGKASYSRITAQQALAMTEPVTRSRGAQAPAEYLEMADEPPHETPVVRGIAPKKPAPKKAPSGELALKSVAPKTLVPKKAVATKRAAKKVSAKSAR
jgi:zinc D-Ala-D-Ala carboxypeptidase